MYVNHVGNSITIALDSQEEALAFITTLTGGQQPNQESDAFGKYVYNFFYRAVYKLATNFAEETKGHYLPFIRSDHRTKPNSGNTRSL